SSPAPSHSRGAHPIQEKFSQSTRTWNKPERFRSKMERNIVPNNQIRDQQNRLCLVAFGCVWLFGQKKNCPNWSALVWFGRLWSPCQQRSGNIFPVPQWNETER